MKYLVFPSVPEAEARSQAAWEEVLGRPVYPEDTTKLLWAIQVSFDGSGEAALVIGEREDLLTGEESAAALDALPQKFTPPEEN